MKKRGFTLIELLIVIVIIGILALIVFGIVGGQATDRANDAAAKTGIADIRDSIELYRVDTGAYPSSLTAEGLAISQEQREARYFRNITYVLQGDCYTLSYTLENARAEGPNINNGILELRCMQ